MRINHEDINSAQVAILYSFEHLKELNKTISINHFHIDNDEQKGHLFILMDFKFTSILDDEEIAEHDEKVKNGMVDFIEYQVHHLYGFHEDIKTAYDNLILKLKNQEEITKNQINYVSGMKFSDIPKNLIELEK